MMLTYPHIMWGLMPKLWMRAFSWHPWIPGTLELDSILSLFKCACGDFMLDIPEQFVKQAIASAKAIGEISLHSAAGRHEMKKKSQGFWKVRQEWP